jgi:hypothetical protein
VVDHVEQHLLPHVGSLTTDHGFMSLAESVVKIPLELHGSLLGSMMFNPDAPILSIVAKFVGGAVKSTYLHDVMLMPSVEDGQHQIEVAAIVLAHPHRALRVGDEFIELALLAANGVEVLAGIRGWEGVVSHFANSQVI